MIRQIGVLLAISVVVASFFIYPIRWKRISLILILTGLTISILWGATFYMSKKGILPPSYSNVSSLYGNRDWNELFSSIIPHLCQMFMYSALFLFPILLVILPKIWTKSNFSARWISLMISLLLSIPVFLIRGDFPNGNYVYNLGLIPRILKDTILYANWRPMLPEQAMNVVRILSVLCTIVLFIVLILSCFQSCRKIIHSPSNPVTVISFIFLVGFSAFTLINLFFYDRYILPFLIFITLLCLSQMRRMSARLKIVAFTAVAGISFFTVTATHDFFAFNRARWQGLNDLTGRGISPKQIDGGFEFNAWYETGPARFGNQNDKTWYFVNDDYYAITQGPLPGYKQYATYFYPAFLTFGTDSVLILQRSFSYTEKISIVCDAEQLTVDKSGFLSSLPGINFGNPETRSDKVAHSGKYSVLVDAAHPFGFTVDLPNVMPGDKFKITVWTRNNEGKAGIVMTATDPKQFYVVEKGLASATGDWQQITLDGTICPGYPDNNIRIYVWNYGGGGGLF